MVMQKDGLIVYEPDTGQIGKNAFSDRLFRLCPWTSRSCREHVPGKGGNGTYTFIDAKGMNVTKEAVWTTVGIRVLNGVLFLFGLLIPQVHKNPGNGTSSFIIPCF